MSNVIMQGKDTVSAQLAECYVTIDGNRYNFMQAINLEAKMEKTKTEVPILGKTGKGNKAAGWKGTGSATFHYNTSVFRRLMKRFKDTGEDVYFDIQVTNEDPASSAGRQTVMRLCAECTVFPNLNDAALQESYRVMGAPALIGAMLTPAEFEAYCERVMEVNGFKTDAEMVDEAKN